MHAYVLLQYSLSTIMKKIKPVNSLPMFCTIFHVKHCGGLLKRVLPLRDNSLMSIHLNRQKEEIDRAVYNIL